MKKRYRYADLHALGEAFAESRQAATAASEALRPMIIDAEQRAADGEPISLGEVATAAHLSREEVRRLVRAHHKAAGIRSTRWGTREDTP